MDKEIEVKFLLRDQAPILRKIAELGLTCVQERVYEKNLRFDLLDGHLVSQKQVLRLRQDNQSRLTFKGPGILEEDVLLRKEIEVVVSDFEGTKRLLEALGYQVVMMYEKYRANYQMDGLVISVDEMPFGLFVELEGESPAQLRHAAGIFCFDWDARINLSYCALLNAFNQNTARMFRDLSFENFSDLMVTPNDLGLRFADLV